MASQEEVRQAAEEAASPFNTETAATSALKTYGQHQLLGSRGAAAIPEIEAGTGAAAESTSFFGPDSGYGNLMSGSSPLGVAGQILGGVGTVYAGAQLANALIPSVLGSANVDALQSAASAQYENLPKTEIKGPGFDIVAGTGDTTYVKVNDPQAFNDFITLIQHGAGGSSTPIPVGEGDRAVLYLSPGSNIARITLPPQEVAKNFESFATVENNLRAGQSILQNTPLQAKASLLEQAIGQPLSNTLSTPSLSEAVLGQGDSQGFTEEQVNQGLQDVINMRTVNPLKPNNASIYAQLGNQVNNPALTVTSTPAGNPARGSVQDTITVTAGSPHISGKPQAVVPASTVGQPPPPTGTGPVPSSGHRNPYI